MSDLRPVETRVDRVTLYEDRADVVRAGEIELRSGPSRLQLRGLPALLDPGRVRVRGRGLALSVDDVRLSFRWLEDESDTARRVLAAREQLKREQAELARVVHELQRAEARRNHLQRLLLRYAAELGAALWAGRTPEGVLASGTRDVPGDAGFALLEAEVRAQDDGVAEIRERLARLRRSVAELSGLPGGDPHRLVADLELSLHAPDGGSGLLEVGYLVPCALWRPSHQAELVRGGEVHWTTFATVWQRTGEDWDDAELTLSTARPSAGAVLPALPPDRLQLRPKAWEERRRIIVEHREAAIPSRDLGQAAPGLYDGGEAQELAPERRQRVASDGKPHRVKVTGFQSPATVRLGATPELAAKVFTEAVLENASARPLLAGPVSLLVDGAFVGVGDLGYVGPGERFELCFGSDDRFRVTLRRRRLEEDRRLGRDRTHFVSEVEVRSLTDEVSEVFLRLRMPRSEIEQLRVVPSEEHCSHGVPRPDEHGVVTLPLTLAVAGRAEASLGFWFDTSGDVVVPDPW